MKAVEYVPVLGIYCLKSRAGLSSSSSHAVGKPSHTYFSMELGSQPVQQLIAIDSDFDQKDGTYLAQGFLNIVGIHSERGPRIRASSVNVRLKCASSPEDSKTSWEDSHMPLASKLIDWTNA